MKKSLLLIVAAALTAFTVHAQDWAKARFEKSPRHPEFVNVKHGAREVNCFITYPEVKDKATAVIVIHEIFGLSDWARSMTDELAEAGYIPVDELHTFDGSELLAISEKVYRDDGKPLKICRPTPLPTPPPEEPPMDLFSVDTGG